MPSTKKTLHFMSSALITCVSVGLLGYGMSEEWSKTTMDCTNDGGGYFNGTAVVTLALFKGTVNRVSCPTFGGANDFQVIPVLAKESVGPTILHSLVLCLLVLCLLCSALSILISLYNSVSNPYETYMGPVGIYACSSLGACLSFVALIIFAVNISVTNMAEALVSVYAASVNLTDKSSEMQPGFFMLIPYTVLSLVAIALIYMYDHAAYTHRREQQRPTEDVPKEIMMY